MFLDEAVVEFSSGRGGSGSAAFHREKHVPLGGPNGADGGKGGDIVLTADRGKRTLYDFKLHPRIGAKDGSMAIGNKRGSDAADIEIRVPIGTIVTNADTGETVADLNFDGARVVLCKGGRGGFGNLHFTNSVRQSPTFAQKGEPGEELRAKLELKLLADIGLIGLPNAGKSTLISRISAAKPRIADYPFTTIEPNLGVVDFADESFTVADMPGLIEGASEGHGLGHQFLKHIERTTALVHIVEVLPTDDSNPLQNFKTIEEELQAYSALAFDKPRLIALNKIDLIPIDDLNLIIEEFQEARLQVFPISAATGRGLEPLQYAMVEQLKNAPKPEAESLRITLGTKKEDDTFEIAESDGIFWIKGRKVERAVAMADMRNEEGVRYLHRQLSRMGVMERLREMGVEEGSTVRIGDVELDFSEDE